MKLKRNQLAFRREEVWEQLEHSRVRDEHSPIHGRPTGPGVFLVHDEGVYLMSTGRPRLMLDPDDQENTRSKVAYALGMDPYQDGWETAHEMARYVVGGDDFGEFLPAEWLGAVMALELPWILITVNKKSLRFGAASEVE